MRKYIRVIKDKMVFLMAIILASVVGGFSTVLVKASIPDANGQINACYRTNGGDLRVRDASNSSDTCSNRETPISWGQGGSNVIGLSAYGHVYADGTLDIANSANILSARWSPADGVFV